MKNLLIAAIGNDVKYTSTWFSSAENKEFDFIALCYEENVSKQVLQYANFFSYKKGYKYPLLFDLLNTQVDLSQYDAFFFPDDDVVISTEKINQLFKLFHEYKLELSQPSLDRESYFSHKITRNCRKKNVLLRYSNFVEIMCPIFSRNALQRCLPTFSSSETGYGLDYVWPNLLNFKDIAIIDAVQAHHARPVQSFQKLKAAGIDSKRLIESVCSQFNAKKFRLKTLSYICS